MEPTVVLFLDSNGVLHPLGELALDDRFRLLPNPGLFQWRPILEEILEPYPEVGIVISSDWRRLFDDDNLKLLLGPRLGGRFLGVVECIDSSRASEILAEVRRRKLQQWLALDDRPSVIEARKRNKRFIGCAPDAGLSSPEVQDSLRQRLAQLLKR